MTLPFEIVLWIFMIISLIYLVVISIITYGWFTLKGFFTPKTLPKTKVSVVIAVRNEAKNIEALLKSLVSQSYPKDMMELIIVDDHSEDNTSILITEFVKLNPGLTIRLHLSESTGKKEAIRQGVEIAGNNFIITTDGDCIPHKQWVRRMTAYYELHEAKIILGPVVYHNEQNWIQKLFSLDFLSLVASGAGSVGAGLPFMGNAANMAFEKEFFLNANLKTAYASGDDVFLIHWVKTQFGSSSIHFIKDARAIVKTESPKNLSSFINQRIRWASKAKGYSNFWAITVSWTVVLLNLSIALLFVAGILWPWMLAIWALFITLKTLIDFPLLNSYAQLTGKSNLLIYILPVEFIYPFYIVAAGFGSLFFPYRWKGRTGLQ